MRAWEFITEGDAGTLRPDVARALPATYSIPSLPNQDPYLQYRFMTYIAAAKGAAERAKDGVPPFDHNSAWGENEIVVSFDPHVADYIDDALKQMGMSPSDKKLISTIKSEESTDVNDRSPVAGFAGYNRKRK